MPPATRDRLARAFREIVGPDGVVSSPDELRVYECDALTTEHRAMPDLVVLPSGYRASGRRRASLRQGRRSHRAARGGHRTVRRGDPGPRRRTHRPDSDGSHSGNRPPEPYGHGPSRLCQPGDQPGRVVPGVLFRPGPRQPAGLDDRRQRGGERRRPPLPEVWRHDQPCSGGEGRAAGWRDRRARRPTRGSAGVRPPGCLRRDRRGRSASARR